MDDLFLKIISGEIPSAKIYEDEHTFAFLDIRPVNKGHALVVPKIHSRNILDIDPETLAQVMATTQRVACALMKALHTDGVTLVMNNEPGGGQEVLHTHFHVIPRFTDDHAFTAPHHTTYAEGEAHAVAQKIQAALA